MLTVFFPFLTFSDFFLAVTQRATRNITFFAFHRKQYATDFFLATWCQDKNSRPFLRARSSAKMYAMFPFTSTFLLFFSWLTTRCDFYRHYEILTAYGKHKKNEFSFLRQPATEGEGKIWVMAVWCPCDLLCGNGLVLEICVSCKPEVQITCGRTQQFKFV